MKGALGGLYNWLGRRFPAAAAREAAEHKTVPVHRYTVFYYLGGMTLFFFVVQVVTGILLMLYYRPSAEAAFESVEFIMTVVPFGWLGVPDEAVGDLGEVEARDAPLHRRLAVRPLEAAGPRREAQEAPHAQLGVEARGLHHEAEPLAHGGGVRRR